MQLPTPPTIPDAQEIYDLLMREIEPELTTNQLPLLAQKYANETAADKKVRMEKYGKAFALYDQKAAAYFADLKKQVNAYRKVAMRSAEKVSAVKEVDALAQLENTISQS